MNYVGIGAAAVASWIAGALWYGVLGKAKMRALGRSPEEIAGPAGRPPVFALVLSFVAEIVMAAMLSGIMVHIGQTTVRGGLISAALIWVGFVITTMATNHAYDGRPPSLTLIDGGHWLAVLLIQGAVLGAFG